MEINFSAHDTGMEADLKQFSKEVEKIVEFAGRNASRKTRLNLVQKSPVLEGDYKAGWSVRTKNEVGRGKEWVIWNRKRYMLVHLLEDGHELIIGGKRVGRVAPVKHFQETVVKGGDDFVEYIEKGLSKLE